MTYGNNNTNSDLQCYVDVITVQYTLCYIMLHTNMSNIDNAVKTNT